MARPVTTSDEEILGAARKVIAARGPDGFSIAEVASEVGLSRAAIILRFKSTHALKVASLEEMVEQFGAALDALPKTPSGDNLLRVAAFIGKHMGSREGSVRFFANYYTSNVTDPELSALERKRGDLLDKAISLVMPAAAIELPSAVLAFRAHLTGTILAWLSLDDPDSRRYLVVRTSEWLKLASIAFTQQTIEELSAPEAVGTTSVTPKRRTRHRSGKRRAKSIADKTR